MIIVNFNASNNLNETNLTRPSVKLKGTISIKNQPLFIHP